MKNIKSNQLVIGTVLIIITSAAGFFAGTKYQQSKVPSFGSGQNMPRFGGNAGGNIGGNNARTRMGGNIAGEILSADGKSVTVKLNDGSNKIILISDKTSVNKASSATVSDLKVGEKIAAFGNANTDGSVTAQNIQINPSNMGRPENVPSGGPTKQ